jgi:hypothetical protein
MIPRDVAHTLLNIAQAVLLNIETGKLLDAKCSLLRMTAIISVETDRSDEVEKWRVAGGFSS